MRRDEAATEALKRAAEAVVEQARTVYLRKDCPRCGARAGQQCRRVVVGREFVTRPELRHSHRERIRLEVPDR